MYGDHLCIKNIYSNSDTEITEKKTAENSGSQVAHKINHF